MYVIPLYPQPIFHTNPIIHSSILLFILPWLPSIPLPTFPPIPSHFSHLIPLMKVFPAGSRPSGSPSEPKASLAPHGPESSARTPFMFRRSHSLTQMFSVGTFVLSLQTKLIPRAAPCLERLFFAKFTQLFPHFIHPLCWNAVEIPP